MGTARVCVRAIQGSVGDALPVKRTVSHAIAALLIVSASADAAFGATQSLLWAGAKRVAVNCLVHSSSGDTAAFETELCDRVRSLAQRGATLPVRNIAAGDPAFVQSDTVILLVHASIERAGSGSTIAFTMRPYRASGGEAEAYFGTAPRAVAIASPAIEAPLDASLRAAVAELLPWQQEEARAPRPL